MLLSKLPVLEIDWDDLKSRENLAAQIIGEDHRRSGSYPVRPEHFDLESGDALLSTFGKAEVEEAAEHLIRFFQTRGGRRWVSFTFEELVDFYREEKLPIERMLFGLISSWQDDVVMSQMSGRPVYHETPRHFLHRCDGR